MNNAIVYGPVPSRRLGRSLGINNIPPKICTYACIYCQLGNTAKKYLERRVFHTPSEIYRSVREKLEHIRNTGEHADYLAFVPDGEPTLDINLGREIDLLKKLGVKIAVITNASTIWEEEVRCDLMQSDWVSLKVDAITTNIWKKINRPDKEINLDNIIKGTMEFARSFKGELTTETMLVKGINDNVDEVNKIAAFLAKIKPEIAYLAVPTRPTAEHVMPAEERFLGIAYETFSKKLGKVELLTGYEGNEFSSTGNVVDDLLSITAVHPMREEAVQELLNELGEKWDIVNQLIHNGSLVELRYGGRKYYARKLMRR